MKRIDGKSFWTRTIAGAVCLILFVGANILGGWWFFGFTALLTMIGLFEFYRCFGMHKSILCVTGFVFSIAYILSVLFWKHNLRFPILVAALLVMSGEYVLLYPKYTLKQVMAGIISVLYVTVLFMLLFALRRRIDGMLLVFLVIISAWGADVFAYLVGSLFGKHPLSPVLSPKKSIEGVIGGVVCSAILGLVFALIAKPYFHTLGKPVLSCMIMCFFGTAFSVMGDLMASAFKRDNEVKDYSKLIPGHGGVLDRFDSILFVVPVIYFLAKALTIL